MGDDVTTSACCRCGTLYERTRENFVLSPRSKDGLGGRCRACDHIRLAVYRDANREKLRAHDRAVWRAKKNDSEYVERRYARRRAWYKENREHVLAYLANWRAANLEQHRRDSREWARNNRDRCNRNSAAWRAKNPDLVRAHASAYAARQRATRGGSFSSRELFDQLRRQHGRCYWCDFPVGGAWDADHVIPLSRGGANHISNVVIACPSCNRSKQAKLPHEFSDRLC